MCGLKVRSVNSSTAAVVRQHGCTVHEGNKPKQEVSPVDDTGSLDGMPFFQLFP